MYLELHAHYRKVNAVIETLHDHLMPCLLFLKDLAGVDSRIFFGWEDSLIDEVHERCVDGKI